MNLNSTLVHAGLAVRRINNPAPVDGPECYEVRDEEGNVLEQSRDRAGAEQYREKVIRERLGLGKRPPSIRRAQDLLNGDITIDDDRLRYTTGGAGGGSGPMG